MERKKMIRWGKKWNVENEAGKSGRASAGLGGERAEVEGQNLKKG